jgi:uncharacterized protein (DUF58 family)
MSTTRSLFSENFLRRLEHLRLVTRRPVAGHLRGGHRSRRTGSGMVFADYRQYASGDDTHHLDWGIFMRLDRLILRLFEEEADLPVYLLVDASASMAHGQPRKFDFARQIGAALAYLSLLNYDRVSVVAWSDGVAAELPMRRGRTQVWPLFRFLEGIEPADGTDLGATLRGFFGASRTRGLVILLSDFLDRGAFDAAAHWLRQFRHEVVAFQVLSPEEMEPQLPDEAVLVDEETGASLALEASADLLRDYRAALEEHCRSIEAQCRRQGWTYLLARTDAPFEDLMLGALRREGVLR